MKIDGLLRVEHPDVGERIDLATELEKAQEEVAGMAKQLRTYQQRATEHQEETASVAKAEGRAKDLEL